MDYIANSKEQQEAMLKSLGLSHVSELFTAIPKELYLKGRADDDGLSEYEGLLEIEQLAEENHFHRLKCYLGAGAYDHYTPAVTAAICQKSEFLTAYTPYQAEASQGMLQAIFEFQSAITALTGLDVANASLYDGASAAAEAVNMARRLKKGKERIVIAGSLHPNYRAVIGEYLANGTVDVVEAPLTSQGCRLDIEALEALLTEETAAVVVQSPNLYGTLEEVEKISKRAKEVQALTILVANPLSYGLYQSAGELGADIAVGDCQPLGLPLNFGGPYVGYMACREALVRQMPGRIIGETVDKEGARGFCLTLQAREQHIRRGKATSNICTNQGLSALACLVTILWYGREGIKELALTNFQRASYLKEELKKIPGVTLLNKGPIFNEFAVELPLPLSEVFPYFESHGIAAGVSVGHFFPERDRQLLIAVTETKSEEDLNQYSRVMKECLEQAGVCR